MDSLAQGQYTSHRPGRAAQQAASPGQGAVRVTATRSAHTSEVHKVLSTCCVAVFACEGFHTAYVKSELPRRCEARAHFTKDILKPV